MFSKHFFWCKFTPPIPIFKPWVIDLLTVSDGKIFRIQSNICLTGTVCSVFEQSAVLQQMQL